MRKIRQGRRNRESLSLNQNDSPLTATPSPQPLQKTRHISPAVSMCRWILIVLVFISVIRVLFCPVHLSPGELKFIQWAFWAALAQLGIELSIRQRKKA